MAEAATAQLTTLAFERVAAPLTDGGLGLKPARSAQEFADKNPFQPRSVPLGTPLSVTPQQLMQVRRAKCLADVRGGRGVEAVS